MKKKLLISLLFCSFVISVSASSTKFLFDNEKIFNSKGKSESVSQKFDSSYKLDGEQNVDEYSKEKELVKQATYYLLGPANNIDETAESYIKRQNAFGDMRYQPDIPKQEDGELDLDSEEAGDDFVASYVTWNMFVLFNDLEIVYKQFDDVQIIPTEDGFIGLIVLNGVSMNVADEEVPMEFDTITADLKIYYTFKENKGKYQIYYMFGQYDDSLENFNDDISNNEYKGVNSINQYDSDLSKIYDFSKANAITQKDIQAIYDINRNNIVIFNTMYDQSMVLSANGMFITDELVVTTWSYIEESLLKGTFLTAKDTKGNILKIDGVVTVDIEKDIAVLKINNGKGTSVKFGNTPNVEDAVILISSKTGSNVSANIGILVSNDKALTTTIPTLKYEEGAPLFNSKGEVVGMNSSKVTNSSLSKAYSNKHLIELQNKFKNIDEVTYISFEELKNNYFVSYKDDKVVNKIDEDVWNKYKKIGNLEKSINIELVKASYKDNVLSLRYKNTLNKLFSNMQLANNFISELKKEKYKEVINESNKKVYVKDKYRVTIMSEFDYLIVVIAEL